MLWRRKTPPARQSAAQRRANAKIISDLLASQHLSEAQNGRHARTLIWTIVIGLGVFLFWASATPVYEVVSGNGQIKPEGLSTRVEHRDGGLVSQILVTEGEPVEVGDVLLRIEDTDLQAELNKLIASLQTLDLNITRNEWVLSLDLNEDDLEAGPEKLLEGSPELIEEIKYRLSQLNTMRAQRDVTQSRRNALRVQSKSVEDELVILRAQLTRFESSRGQDVIPLARLEDLRREVLRLQSNLGELVGQIDVETATLAQMRATERELIARYRREASLELRDQVEQRTAVNQSILQVQERLKATVLRAPVAGTINALSVQNAGEVLGAGEMVAEIIPHGQSAFAEVEIPADRISGVKVGRAASIKVLTYDFTRYGDFEAVVKRISPSSFVKENGETVFRVQLSFEQDRANAGPEGVRSVTPGMTVIADVKAERRTVLSYLLKPVRVIADRALTEA